jgi:hypothetical protein
MNASAVTYPHLAKARHDLEEAVDAMGVYWARSTSDIDGQLHDTHVAVEALVRAIASLACAVERISQLVEA